MLFRASTDGIEIFSPTPNQMCPWDVYSRKRWPPQHRLSAQDILVYVAPGTSDYALRDKAWVLVFSKFGLCEVHMGDIMQLVQ